MSYQPRDYSFLEETLETMESPMANDFGDKLIFSTKDKKKVPYPDGKKFDDIYLRILPAGTGRELPDEKPWTVIKRHYLETQNKFVDCKADGEDCPYCEMGKKPSALYRVNVLVMDNPYQPETIGEVKIFELNRVLFRELYVAMQPVENIPPIFPFDLVKGNDFRLSGVVELNKNGKPSINWAGSRFEKTSKIAYFIKDEDDNRIRKPLNEEQIDELLEKRHDLKTNSPHASAKPAEHKPAAKKPAAKADYESEEEDEEIKPAHGKAAKSKSNYFDQYS